MADISITKNHSLELETARGRLEKLAGELQQKYGIKSSWSGNVCNLSGTGLKSGVVEVTASSVKVDITLGLLAKAMKGTILEQINSNFDKALS